jgi:hypothetical protein
MFIGIVPSMHTYIAHNISGYGLSDYIGPNNTNIACAGASDNNYKSFGEFL